jgi:hypothetical protein
LNGVAAAPCVEWFLDLQAAPSPRPCRVRRLEARPRPSVLGKGKNVGGRRPCAVFLDPPYSFEFRDPYLYAEDDAAISAQVREWALEHGTTIRTCEIALCGYEGEHEMPQGDLFVDVPHPRVWKAARGLRRRGINDNRERRAASGSLALPI